MGVSQKHRSWTKRKRRSQEMLVLHSSFSLPFVELTLLLLSVAFDPSQGTSCPCIDGGQWTYQGGSYSYCSNPNSARTSWCPRELNADGSYTADLGFAFCEGDLLTACQAAKEANKPACPCVDGGAWKYRGKPQSYCSDPTNAGFTWCATAVDANGNFQSDYAICESDVKEACDALKEAEPLPECPCLAGGQWTYDGEPQSYCQQPIGRAPWCPTSSASVTPATMGSVSVQYCEGRVLEACQVLEGTKIEDSCPCVQGGQWSHRGVQYSYCEEKNQGSVPPTPLVDLLCRPAGHVLGLHHGKHRLSVLVRPHTVRLRLLH